MGSSWWVGKALGEIKKCPVPQELPKCMSKDYRVVSQKLVLLNTSAAGWAVLREERLECLRINSPNSRTLTQGVTRGGSSTTSRATVVLAWQ